MLPADTIDAPAGHAMLVVLMHLHLLPVQRQQCPIAMPLKLKRQTQNVDAHAR